MAIRSIKTLKRLMNYSNGYVYKVVKRKILASGQKRKHGIKAITDEDILEFVLEHYHPSISRVIAPQLQHWRRRYAAGEISIDQHPFLNTKWLKVKDAAKKLGVSEKTLYAFATKEHHIAYHRPTHHYGLRKKKGGAIRINELDLEQFEKWYANRLPKPGPLLSNLPDISEALLAKHGVLTGSTTAGK